MQQSQTTLVRGGLNLVTPPVASPAGVLIAGVNYEPDVGGTARIKGYERFDGHPSPSAGSDASEIASRRAAISAVPGAGPIRGGIIYNGAVYAFRDTALGDGAMWKATSSGWVQQSFGSLVMFNTGTTEFLEGETVTGGTSGAVATIKRVYVQSGTWSGNDAAGYLVVSGQTGNFDTAETITSSSGSATCSGEEAVSLTGGGTYICFVHNFFGAAYAPRLYFTNGVNAAMEWDGETLAPLRSGTDSGPISLAALVLNATGGYVLMPDGGRVLLYPDFDIPRHCAEFSNHLFLGFRNGGIVHSGVGEPGDFRAIAGAGTYSFSDEITAMMGGAFTALLIFGRDRIDYFTGNDSSDFVQKTLSDSSGALAGTPLLLDQPYYWDDAGMRKLFTSSSFGDWNIGTVTQPIQPLIRKIQEAGTRPAASAQIKIKDQYRLFWDDGTGLSVYLGRKYPEMIPLKWPITVTCAWSGEVSSNDGSERIFVGASNGYVYEIEKGTSFDGDAIQAYLRLVWNAVKAPAQNKRFHSTTFGIDAPSAVTIGVVHHVDYGRNQEGTGVQTDVDVDAGSLMDWTIADYADVDWTVSDQGELKAYLDGFGQNIAISLVSESATQDPHTLLWQRLNYTPRSTLR